MYENNKLTDILKFVKDKDIKIYEKVQECSRNIVRENDLYHSLMLYEHTLNKNIMKNDIDVSDGISTELHLRGLKEVFALGFLMGLNKRENA